MFRKTFLGVALMTSAGCFAPGLEGYRCFTDDDCAWGNRCVTFRPDRFRQFSSPELLCGKSETEKVRAYGKAEIGFGWFAFTLGALGLSATLRRR